MVAGGALVALAGCATGPPPPLWATSTAPVEAVRSRVSAALEQDGLEVEATPDGLRVASDAARFTRCRPVLVGGSSGSDSSRKMVRVEQRRGEARVHFTPAGEGTRVDWATSYAGRYRNSIRNDHFTRACEGTGALEALLAAAVAG